jgi:DNA-directed RNA polymerase subunit RPC12/RpoP
MEEQNEITDKAQTDIQKCPNCGAELVYDIESGKLVCGHCNFQKDIEGDNGVARRELTADIMQQREIWTGAKVYRCNNCGSKSVIDVKQINQKCSFCGSSNVVSTEELTGIKPDSIIPFAVTKNNAEEIFKKWVKKRKMAPRIFIHGDIRESMCQTYYPVWRFCANTNTRYHGVLGKREAYTVRDREGRTHIEWRTNYFDVSGSIYKQYTDYLIQCSNQISQITFQKVQPFDMQMVKPYRSEYLSGIAANHYSRDLETCFNDFGNFVRADVRKTIIRNHNADTVQRLNTDTEYSDKRFNYTLLPLYIAHYQFKKKTYNFFVNGISGKIVGKSPISMWKVLFKMLFWGIVGAGIAGIGYFIHKYTL